MRPRIHPILGFKQFRNAAVTISGIELVRKIKKGQFDASRVANGARLLVAQTWDIATAA